MGRNIVLCSDGTGNKGGTGSDTNVFKIYHAIQGGANEREQITFYDDGVGTATNGFARAIGGATGAGFKRNVRDLYEFAGRHYRDGDDLYAFGFSRGAATIRAFAGMIEHCGLVRRQTGRADEAGNEVILDEDEFQRQIDAAMATYAGRGTSISLGRLWQAIFPPGQYERHDVEIEFLGLWDTVAALGFPQIWLLDSVVNFFRRHEFYDLEPPNAVKNVLHAVAVDDERRTFWPLVWDENAFRKDGHIEQVWFAGVHSNVGGGYPRPGLANVTLDWMISRLDGHALALHEKDPDRGLRLETAFREQVRDGVNPTGKLVDSRGGFARWYRYQPRPIVELCSGKLRDELPRIHASVLERMQLRTRGYAPGQLPPSFQVVESHDPDTLEVDLQAPESDGAASGWQAIRNEIDRATGSRITLYWFFLLTSLVLVGVSFRLWIGDLDFSVELGKPWREASTANWALGHVADVLRYVLPEFFENAVNYAVLREPAWGGGVVATLVVYYGVRTRFKRWSDRICETARIFVLRRTLDRLRMSASAR